METRTRVVLEAQPGIAPRESNQLGSELASSLVEVLEGLTSEEWSVTSRCDPWTPKDIAAHLLGWAEALTSPRELGSQTTRALRLMKEYGNVVDAQNGIQVEDRRHLSERVLLDKLTGALHKEGIARLRFGTALRYLPLYVPYLGGATTAGYLFNTIFLRDLLIHRLDICHATGREPHISYADERVMTDMLKDWAHRTDADVQVDDGHNVYVAGAGTNTIAAPLDHVIEALAGRRDVSSLDISGETERVETWLARRVPI